MITTDSSYQNNQYYTDSLDASQVWLIYLSNIKFKKKINDHCFNVLPKINLTKFAYIKFSKFYLIHLRKKDVYISDELFPHWH